MQRKTSADFDPEVLKLFDKYVHGIIDRRGFLLGAAKYAVGGITATALLDALNPKFAEAEQVKKNDSRINARFVEYASPAGHGRMRGYLAQPAQAADPCRQQSPLYIICTWAAGRHFHEVLTCSAGRPAISTLKC